MKKVCCYVRVSTEPGKGYSDFLYETLLKRHNRINTIYLILAGTNLEILQNGMKAKLSPEIAATKTPAYKSRLRQGFTDIQVIEDGAGYSLKASRPTK